MKRRPHLVPACIAAVTLVVALAGCGRVAPTSPDAGLDAPPSATPASAVASHAAPASSTSIGVAPDDPGTINKTTTGGLQPVLQPVRVLVDPITNLLGGLVRLVLSVVKWVLPGVETNVSTSRWSLDIHSGSLTQPKLISILQATDGTLRATFGPDGTQFVQAVDVTVSYAGTTLDPSSRSYVRGTQPVFLWLDPATGKWVEMPSTNDPATRTVHARLQHFSSYAVGGRAGW